MAIDSRVDPGIVDDYFNDIYAYRNGTGALDGRIRSVVTKSGFGETICLHFVCW